MIIRCADFIPLGILSIYHIKSQLILDETIYQLLIHDYDYKHAPYQI
jgi:hypothetical protein